MKKSVITASAILLAIVCALFAVFAFASEKSVYVSSSGIDTRSGESAEESVRTIERAFELLPDGGRIVLCGSSYSLGANYNMPASDKKYTLTSEMTGALTYSGTLSLHSDFEIENIRLGGSSTPIIVCNGNNVTFGEGIVNLSDTYIVGGANLTASSKKADGTFKEDYTIRINSGTWRHIFGGNRRSVGQAPTCTISGDITIIVDGATLTSTGASATANLNSISGMNATTGDLTFIMNSGEIKGSLYAISRIGTSGSERHCKGNIRIEINGGSFSSANSVISMCQQMPCEYDGDCSVKISPDAVVKCSSITAEGVLGKKTISAPAEVLAKAQGFARDVYVSSSGSDKNSGASPEQAFATLEHAFSALAKDGGGITICSDITVGGKLTAAKAAEDIAVRSLTGAEALVVDGTLELRSNVTFDNMVLRGSGAVYSAESSLTFGKNVTGDGTLDLSAVSLSGDLSTGGMLILEGGSFDVVSAGALYGNGALCASGTLVTLEGASVNILCVSSGNDINGTCSVSVKSGTVKEGIWGIYEKAPADIKGTASVEIGGGNIGGVIFAAPESMTAKMSGSYSLTVLGGELADNIRISGVGFESSVAEKSDLIPEQLFSGFDSVSNQKAVFVLDGGSGKKDGSSADNAFASVNDAVKAIGNDSGIIIICGKTTVKSFAESAHNGKIKYTSRYGGTDYRRESGAVFKLGTSFEAGGAVVFDDITIETSGGTQLFFGCGNPITFGSAVECVINGTGSTYPYIYGGTNSKSSSVTSCSVTVMGGHFNRVIGGHRYDGAVAEGISVTVSGGIIDAYVAGSGAGTVNGGISVTVRGGSINWGVYAISGTSGANAFVSGDVSVTIDGGDITGPVSCAYMPLYATFNGTYKCYINTQKLDSVTEITGTDGISGRNESELIYAENVDPTKKQIGSVEYQNPIISGADPWVIFHEGYYYMAVTRGSSVTIAKALTVAELGTVEPVAVWTAGKNTGLAASVWSPELHYFSAEDFGEEYAGWYLYIACPPYDNNDNYYRRCYALRALTDDPQGEYGSPVDKTPNIPVQIKMDADNTNWNIGPSIFRIDGKIYMTWTGRKFEFYGEHVQNLNIAEMVNPYTLDLSHSGVICWPTETWEKQGATYSSTTEKNMPEVVEGATAVYADDGTVYCIYSASGYWTDHYALAQLKFLGGDPCDINNWEKSKQPIFTQNKYGYGPGHASYTTSPSGGTRYFIYHAYLQPGRVGGRYIFVETYTVDQNGVHLGSGTPTDTSTILSVQKNHATLADRVFGFDSITGGKVNDQTEPAPTPEDTTTAPVTDTPKNGSDSMTVILIAAVAVAVITVGAAAAVLLMPKKKTVKKTDKKAAENETSSTNDGDK